MDKLTASEALYGFASWLTSRDKAVTASSKHDAAIWAVLVDKFCTENDLAPPRDEWVANLIRPMSEDSND